MLVYESGYTKDLVIHSNNTIRDELLHFIASVKDPQTETRNSGVVGVKTVELIEAAKKSAMTGSAVALATG